MSGPSSIFYILLGLQECRFLSFALIIMYSFEPPNRDGSKGYPKFIILNKVTNKYTLVHPFKPVSMSYLQRPVSMIKSAMHTRVLPLVYLQYHFQESSPYLSEPVYKIHEHNIFVTSKSEYKLKLPHNYV